MHYLMTGCYPGETELKGKLSCIIDKCVRLSKEERYQTVEELMRDLTKGFEEPKKEMSTKKGNIFTRSLYRYKKSKGVIYYEVPADATEVIAEYETDFWTQGKIVFVIK